MKFSRFGALSALLAGAALVGCSSDQNGGAGEQDSSIGFKLTTADGVVITSVNYDLNTQGPPAVDVVDGSIPVPNPGSTISLGIESLHSGAYSLAFSATGTKGAQTYSCVSAPKLFTLAASTALPLGAIDLHCTTTVAAGDTSSSVTADVTVSVETITVDSNIVETFTFGPRSVKGVAGSGTSCTYPPINLKVARQDAAIGYTWSTTGDGAITTPTATTATYTCASGGTKTLTLTAVKGAVTASKNFTVTCDASACLTVPPTCGDGVVNQASEQCDPAVASPRCTGCLITPTCGDGIVDGPSGACFGGGTSPLCNEACDTAGDSATCTASCTAKAPPTCGDGVVNQASEQCDGGPTGNATCNPDCTLKPVLNFPNCIPCINADPDLGPFQASSCTAACQTLESCFIETGCFSPIAAKCYCGPDTGPNCEADSFVPSGPCAALIKAAVGPGQTNAQYLQKAVLLDNASGVAWTIVSAAEDPAGTCLASCVAP